jgi:hypothetical protein
MMVCAGSICLGTEFAVLNIVKVASVLANGRQFVYQLSNCQLYSNC